MEREKSSMTKLLNLLKIIIIKIVVTLIIIGSNMRENCFKIVNKVKEH